MGAKRKVKKEKAIAIKRPKTIQVDLWECKDLKAAIKRKIKANVKDAKEAKALENSLANIIAYGVGSTANVALKK